MDGYLPRCGALRLDIRRPTLTSLWPIITVLGPILLLGVMIYAWVQNRRQPESEIRRSEEAARELRERIDAEDAD